jgi:GT2 family glycosyltransferase
MAIDAFRRPDLSIIVVTHQGRDKALDVLQAAHERLGPITAEWLVVDSGSTDGTPDAVEAVFPHIVVFRRPNIGFAAANNVALRVARGRPLLALNPDMEIASGTLAELVAQMDARPEVGVASAVTYYPDGLHQPTIRRFPTPGRQLGEALMLTRWRAFERLQEEDKVEAHYGQEQRADWVAGGFMLVRREAYEQAGGFDERFFLFSEETDWCTRIRAAGWDIRHLPGMVLVHHTGRAMRPDLFAQNSYAKVLYARKHMSPRAAAAFRAAIALRHAVRYAGFAPRARSRPELGQRVAAERRALRVVLGVEPPPYVPYAERPADPAPLAVAA